MGERTWRTVAGDSYGNGAGWTQLPNGSFGAFRGIPLTGMHFAVSNDNGLTWQKRGELNWIQLVYFITNENGYAVRIDSRGAFSAEKSEFSLWRTEDGGRNWSRVGPTPGIPAQLVSLGGTAQLGFATPNGRFYVSEDGGSTWKLERQVP